jgi:hypothetical protein
MDRRTDRIRCAAKPRLPRAVAEHGHRSSARRAVLLGEEESAKGGADAEHRQEVMRNNTDADLRGLRSSTQVAERRRQICTDAVEGGDVLAQRHVVAPRTRPA